MSNQRSVMTEFRFLDQKRQAEGLTAQETTRYAQLRDLVGAETAGPTRSGFDVNAAAARLRESLLPAGLRARPAEVAPAAPAEPPAAAPAPEAPALEEAWAQPPFAGLEAPPADPLLDPGSLAQEVRPQAWNPEAPGYDPDAPYDEAAWIAAGYDPNATYDWSAYGEPPDGQPDLTGAAPGAPLEPASDAAPEPVLVSLDDAELITDLTDQPLELAEAPPLADAGLAVEPSAEAGDAQPWDAAAEAVSELTLDDLGAGSATPVLEQSAPEAVPALDLDDLGEEPPAPFAEPPAPAAPLLEEAPPFDSSAPFDHAKWFGHAGPPASPAPSLEPVAPAEVPFDAGLEPEAAAAPATPAFGEYDDAAPLAMPGAPDLLAGGAPALVEGPPLELLPADPGPADAPFGAYDEMPSAAGGGLELGLAFDPAAASAIEAGDLPEGYDPVGPVLDPATLPPAVPGAYDDEAAFPADQAHGGPGDGGLPGGAPLELGESIPDWQPEAALAQGFQLASDGSFGHAEPPRAPTPAWGTPAAAAPEGWESAPALDLGAPFELPSPTPARPMKAVAPAPLLAEDLPVVDGAELLVELPPEEPEPALSYQDPLSDPPPELAAGHFDPGVDAAAPPAAAPLDDAASEAGATPDRFARPPAVAERLFEPAPEPLEAEPPPAVEVPGTHRVVLHTADGQVRRGLLVDTRLDEPVLPLWPQGPGTPEEIPAEAVKAIFFMLSPGERAPTPEGRKVRVTFRDGRQVAGHSPDYREGTIGFFMIPADTRTNTGRIWVYQAAVKAVAVS